jgi:hypothetical protein
MPPTLRRLICRPLRMIPSRWPAARHLITLEDAGAYITELPKAEQQLEELAGRGRSDALLVVEHNGPTMMARISMLRALNRHVERVFNSDRKDTHWGKRKLKRDE